MPEVSIIVVSLAGGESLVKVLQSMQSIKAEFIVLLDFNNNHAESLQQSFPGMQFVDSAKLSVPEARQRGIECASNDVVALLEDTSIPAATWHNSVLKAFSNDDVVAVGGPVVLSPGLGGKYLALGCGEYGRFHPSRYGLMAEADQASNDLLPVERLPGNNLAYRRDIVRKLLQDSQHGLIEGEINEQLKSSGNELFMHPEMVVEYSMKDEHGVSLGTRFNHGRLYAGNRVVDQGWGVRLSWFVKALLLPAVLTLRGWSSMTHAVNKLDWPKTMLWILLMETCWALGEATGYLSGVGNSMESWQ